MTNNKKVLKVLKGFSELTIAEREEFINEANEFINGNFEDKEKIKRLYETKLFSSLGPTNDNNCPCCGKG